jgi:hypothetical protein
MMARTFEKPAALWRTNLSAESRSKAACRSQLVRTLTGLPMPARRCSMMLYKESATLAMCCCRSWAMCWRLVVDGFGHCTNPSLLTWLLTPLVLQLPLLVLLLGLLLLLTLAGARAGAGVLLRIPVPRLLSSLRPLDAAAASAAATVAGVVLGMPRLHGAGSMCRGPGATRKSSRRLLLSALLLPASCMSCITTCQHHWLYAARYRSSLATTGASVCGQL